MASVTPCKNTRNFFESGTPQQFEWILKQYDQCLRIKAEHKSQRPENVIKLDKWYQNELPKKIKSRGKDAHLVHEEMVQTIKWKLARGKFRPNLTNLVQMNTPRVVMQETKKGLRKIYKNDDLHGAVLALSNLKGCGPALASAVLAAGAPHIAPFMADEILLALPEVDCLEYTMKEYMRMVEHVNACVERLNAQGGDWTPHTVELAIWTYYIANDLKPEILEGMPSANATSADSKDKADNGNGAEEKKEEEGETAAAAANGEDSNLSAAGTAEDSNMSATSTGDEEAASNGKETAATSSAASSQPSSQEASPKSSDVAPAPEAAAATEPEKTNGNNGTAAKENGSSNSTPAAPESSSSTSSTSAATTAEATTTPSKSNVIQTEENTSDSTKENQEEATSGKAAVKRPAEANDENAQEASSAGEATENAADASAAAAAEPVAKKLKSDEEAPTVPAV